MTMLKHVGAKQQKQFIDYRIVHLLAITKLKHIIMQGMNNIKEICYLCSIFGYHICISKDSENHLTIRLQFKNTNCVNFEITFILKVTQAS